MTEGVCRDIGVAQTAICTKYLQTTNPLNCPDVIVITASLSAGAIAGIVIAIVACLVIASLSGKKGYDVWLRNRNNMTSAQTNVLYTDEGRTGTNPLHEK